MDNLILIVEDDYRTSDLVKIAIEKDGFKAIVAQNGKEAMKLIRAYQPILVILDLMLPDMDGIDLCKILRSESNLPVLILTAKREEQDKLLGFSMGADDYMIKPFSTRELVARVRAILKRYNRLPLKDIEIDLEGRSVKVGSRRAHLTLYEVRILKTLIGSPGKIFSRMELIRQVYPLEDINVTDRTVDVHIRKLREKIEQNPARPRYIITVRCQGYKFLS